MAKVKFTYALKRFYPNLNDLEIDGENVNELLEKIEIQFPGIKTYLLDDHGRLRKHVNIFIDGTLLENRNNLIEKINAQTEVFIMQALSGG